MERGQECHHHFGPYAQALPKSLPRTVSSMVRLVITRLSQRIRLGQWRASGNVPILLATFIVGGLMYRTKWLRNLKDLAEVIHVAWEIVPLCIDPAIAIAPAFPGLLSCVCMSALFAYVGYFRAWASQFSNKN